MVLGHFDEGLSGVDVRLVAAGARRGHFEPRAQLTITVQNDMALMIVVTPMMMIIMAMALQKDDLRSNGEDDEGGDTQMHAPPGVAH
mmetsp:Transcript_3791/g.7201  ORF Transcript_3791/g.7201 Transcript_3791/m.7201 type:complete len:87 (-) Transcript_3791:21-281(-)